ncbi:hypothetical protein [Streptomyces sp. AHA2]|uniref:hypothetical protein n=1 Tax=Streptomyces sp. AHA2 TaxID=3064526 RepID=UPI002FE13562
MTTPGFRPTHVVPQHGMPAWEAPDPSRPTVDLDPLLPVQLLERQGDWGHVLCFNGWSAWVDGRRLVAVPQDPPTTDGPLTRTADPRPLLGRAQQALARYRSAVEDLANGLDLESFRTRTRGTRIGVVVDGESVWLYDSAHGRWVYADGTRLTTYATDDTPRADRPAPVDGPEPSRPHAASAHPPTRVVAETPAAAQDPPRAATAPPPAGAPPPQEPTRVVSPGATAASPPEPTRVAGPEEFRKSEQPGQPGEADQAKQAPPPAAAPPTRAVRHPPTRVVPPEGDGR